MTSAKVAKNVLDTARRYLPDSTEIDTVFRYEMHPETLLSFDKFPIASHSDQHEALVLLQSNLAQALEAYTRLNQNVQRQLNQSFSRVAEQNSQHEKVGFFHLIDGQWEPIVEVNPIEYILRYTSENAKPGLRAARQSIDQLVEPGSKELHYETLAKAFLVARLRKFWSRYREERAPLKPSGRAEFTEFVADIIAALEKDWDPESTINAWYNRRQFMDRYGLNS